MEPIHPSQTPINWAAVHEYEDGKHPFCRKPIRIEPVTMRELRGDVPPPLPRCRCGDLKLDHAADDDPLDRYCMVALCACPAYHWEGDGP